MGRVVRAVVAGVGMSENREVTAIERKPLGYIAELFDRNRQLAAATRVRSDRTKVIMALRHTEPVMRCATQSLSLLHLVRVKINMRVKITDHAAQMRSRPDRVQKSVDRAQRFRLVEFRGVTHARNRHEPCAGCGF